jgi:Flp pilus assembly protein TadG
VRLRCERGEVPTLLIVFLTAMIALFGAIHVAVVMKARSVVAAAAQDGLHAAQIYGGTSAEGQTAAEATLALDPRLTNRNVTVAVSTAGGRCDQVRVQVSARVATPVINLFNDVRADVIGPCDRFYAEDERR